jgi:hypothetical protein
MNAPTIQRIAARNESTASSSIAGREDEFHQGRARGNAARDEVELRGLWGPY